MIHCERGLDGGVVVVVTDEGPHQPDPLHAQRRSHQVCYACFPEAWLAEPLSLRPERPPHWSPGLDEFLEGDYELSGC